MAYQKIHNNLHPFFQYTIPPPLPLPPPPLSSPHANSGDSTSFPILAISIVGMLTTAILLLSYYVFVIKCCLNWHHSDVLLLRRFSHSRRQHHRHIDDFRLRSANYSEGEGEGERGGLDESTIQAIWTLRFRNRETADCSSTPLFRDCAVCLNEFQEEEKMRMLPNCYHVFHIDCIDTWLQNHSNCPLCRADITTHSVLLATAQQVPRPREMISSTTGRVIQIVVVDDRDNDHGRRISDRDQLQADHEPVSYNSDNYSISSRSYVSKLERKMMNVQQHSMGDECIDPRGEADKEEEEEEEEEFNIVQQMRRSFSMDSSCDSRQLYMAVQEILQQNPHFRGGGVLKYSTRPSSSTAGEGSSNGSGSGRIRKSLFSFSRSTSKS